MRPVLVVLCVIALCTCAGCTGTGQRLSWSVDNNGVLALTCAPAATSEDVLVSNETWTKTRIVMHTPTGDVISYLAAPRQPKAAIVYVPGAGEKIAGHEDRMVKYTAAGYAFLFVDVRGNGAETPGYPFNPQADYGLFEKGQLPQIYSIVCDISTARGMLADRFGVPVYALGSSNGGRYAAIAAATDPEFSGYIGVSTSGFGMAGEQYSGDTRRFLLSLDPDNYISRISPRPVWIFHSATDNIIPFTDGQELYERAQAPRTFTGFDGGHGINSDVDDRIILQWAQIYGNRG